MRSARPPRPARSPLRRHWPLDPKIVFLNHGSFGACPKAVLRHQSALRQEMEAEPVDFLWRTIDERLSEARRGLARFLGARPEDLAFVPNATTAVNAVVRSWPLKRGDEILTTNLDYNACRNVLTEWAGRIGAQVVVAGVPFPLGGPDEIVESVLAAVTPRTRFAMLDHVTSNTALVLPVDRLTAELEARGIQVLVDGAHAPGMVPLDFRRFRPGWFTGNLHKWVCAPKGAAFLWVRPDHQEDIHPVVVSHGYNTPRPGYPTWQDRFDWVGTIDPTAWLSVPTALDTVGNMGPGGWSEVRRHNHKLVVAARRLLARRLGLTPPCPEKMLGSMATLPLPERFQDRPVTTRIAAEQTELFQRFGIEVPLVKVGGLRCFRVSAHLHNHLAEYEYLAAAWERIS